MSYYANLSSDLPAPYKQKRVIFYRQGLKVYGLIPYLLQRKLKAQFFSGEIRSGNTLMSMGSFESNWTAIPYHQIPENLKALLDWLYSDRGFEVAIASEQDWYDDIFSANVYRTPPRTWFPAGTETREGFLQITGKSDSSRQDMLLLFAESKGEAEDE